MKSALITFNSKKGKTLAYAGAIKQYLESRGVSVRMVSVADCEPHHYEGVDAVFLGCWTSGLMIIAQKPEKRWMDYAKKVPDLKDKKIVLFTTYLIATGSMFSVMQKHLKGKVESIALRLKSRKPSLSELDIKLLDSLFGNNS